MERPFGSEPESSAVSEHSSNFSPDWQERHNTALSGSRLASSRTFEDQFEQCFASPLEVGSTAAELLWLDLEQSVTERPAAKRSGRPEGGTHLVALGDQPSDLNSESIGQRLESAKALERDPAGKQKLRDMLAGKNGDDGVLAAHHILQLMVGNDPQERRDGERMLKLVLDEEREPIAVRLLCGLVVNAHHIHQFLELTENHPGKTESKELIKLLQSGSSREYGAALNLLSLSAQKDRGGSTAVRDLVSMLQDDKRRDDALVILSEFGDAKHVRPMLQLMGSPESQAAARSLVDLLRTDSGSRAVKRLLECSASNFGIDRSEAQAVLGMFNDSGQKELAVRVLSLGLDADRQRTLIDRLPTRTPANGERFILDTLELGDPQSQNAVTKLLDSLASTNGRERERAEKLIGLVGDEKHQSAGLAVLKHLDNKPLQDALFDILAEPSLKESGQQVLQMLAGDRKERNMAVSLVSMWAGEKFGTRPAAMQLLEMLSASDKGTARTILRNIDGFDADNVLSALKSENLKGGATVLLGMLSSQDQREQSMGRSLVEMLRGSRERSPFADPDRPSVQQNRAADQTAMDGQTLMSMLQDPQGKEIARQILSDVPELHQRRTMLALLANKESRAQADELLAWLKDPKMTAAARGILDQIARPADVASALKTIKLASEEDRAVLIQLAEGGGLRQLVSLSRSPEPSQQRAGAVILEMLKDPNQHWQARNFLKPNLTPESLSFLVGLSQSTDGATATAADSLVTMLNMPTLDSSTREADVARTILGWMQSASAEQARTGNQLFRLLAQPDGPAPVVELASPKTSSDALGAALRILNDAQPKRAEKFRMMVLSEANGEDVTWRPLCHLLSSRNPVMQQFGRRMLEMLDDPRQQSRAQKILSVFGSEEALDEFGELFTRPSGTDAGNALMQMLIDGDPAHIVGVGNSFRTLAFGSPDARAAAGGLIVMLSDPQQRDVGKMILSRLPDQLAWGGMLTVLNDPVAKKAALEVLSNGDRDLHRRLTDVLALSADPGRLFTLLASEKTAPLTKQVLPHVTARNVGVLTDLISADSKHPALISLLEMLNLPETRESARVVLERASTTETALHLVAMLRNPASKPQAEALLRWLGDDDLGKMNAAENILQLLLSPEEKMQSAGRGLLQHLVDPSRQESVQAFARILTANELVTAAAVLSDRRFSHAVARMQEIVSYAFDPFEQGTKDRYAVVGTLLRLLGSSDPAAAKEGQRLLEMLNDPRYERAAMREARRHYQRRP